MRIVFAFLAVFLLTSCGDKRNSVAINDKKLYFKEPVRSEEAMNTLKWLISTNHNFSEPPLDFGLEKEGGTYVFNYPVNIKGAENEPGNISFIETFAERLSIDVLKGAPVKVRLTDEDWKKEKRVIRYK